jgi:hypothetical protein
MSVDYETDKVIQESLRTELGKDVTLLTVAHRLQSVMSADRIVCVFYIHPFIINPLQDGPRRWQDRKCLRGSTVIWKLT